jgi:hypothetical protein
MASPQQIHLNPEDLFPNYPQDKEAVEKALETLKSLADLASQPDHPFAKLGLEGIITTATIKLSNLH